MEDSPPGVPRFRNETVEEAIEILQARLDRATKRQRTQPPPSQPGTSAVAAMPSVAVDRNIDDDGNDDGANDDDGKPSRKVPAKPIANAAVAGLRHDLPLPPQPATLAVAAVDPNNDRPPPLQGHEQDQSIQQEPIGPAHLPPPTYRPTPMPPRKYNKGKWSDEEHMLFLECYIEFGPLWNRMTRRITTRSSAQIRSHAQTYLKRLKKDAA